jgi:hypothetical protein
VIADFQIWLVETFMGATAVRALMHSVWVWPIVESLHFAGLSMLVGAIFTFDLRLLGVARSVPIRTMHRLIRWGIGGFVLNVSTGVLFVLAEPEQYIYNPAFLFKVLFITLAGMNAGFFYLSSYGRLRGDHAPANAPRLAKIIALLSICLWLGVVIAGRLITFYRPFWCAPGELGTIATCISE